MCRVRGKWIGEPLSLEWKQQVALATIVLTDDVDVDGPSCLHLDEQAISRIDAAAGRQHLSAG